jgi:FkbM family methyltransferase
VDSTPLGPIHKNFKHFIHRKWGRGEKSFDANHVLTTLHNGQKIIVNKDDNHVCFHVRNDGVWEKEQIELLEQIIRPGFHIVEWGSNYGAHTLFMAEKVGPRGKVFAFEANPNVYRYLEQSIALNHLNDRIVLFKKGVSNHTGTTILSYTSENIGGGGIGGTGEHTVTIDTVCTDNVLPADTRCDILKMDIEGHEWKAIQGAQRLFQDNPNMIVMMEWSPLSMGPAQSEDLIRFMQDQGYNAWRIRRWGLYKKVVLDPVTKDELLTLEQKRDNHPKECQWGIIWSKDPQHMNVFKRKAGISP